jgi:hypothetical protein
VTPNSLTASTPYLIRVEILSSFTRIFVNNSLACSETRAGRRPFSQAYLYLSDPWYAAADASLTDMWFQVSEVSLAAHSA